MSEAMHAVSLKLPEELDRALMELARRRHSTRSALIREAIEQFTREHRRSVTDLAEGLVGCLSGPTDLSSNAEHLSGYGE